MAINGPTGAGGTAQIKVTPAGTGPMLGRGSTGDAVTALQTQLKAAGFLSATPDGKFGPATEKAVKAFQTSKGVPADGVVGPATSKLLGAAAPAPTVARDKAVVTATPPKAADPLLSYGPPAPTSRLQDQEAFVGSLGESTKKFFVNQAIEILHPIETTKIQAKALADATLEYEKSPAKPSWDECVAHQNAKIEKAYSELGHGSLKSILAAMDTVNSWGTQALDVGSQGVAYVAAAPHNIAVAYHNADVALTHEEGSLIHRFGDWISGGGKSLEGYK